MWEFSTNCKHFIEFIRLTRLEIRGSNQSASGTLIHSVNCVDDFKILPVGSISPGRLTPTRVARKSGSTVNKFSHIATVTAPGMAGSGVLRITFKSSCPE